jgi:hypothetical protein
MKLPNRRLIVTELSNSQVLYMTDSDDKDLEKAVAQNGNELVNIRVNTESGHCAKLLALLTYFNKKHQKKEKKAKKEKEDRKMLDDLDEEEDSGNTDSNSAASDSKAAAPDSEEDLYGKFAQIEKGGIPRQLTAEFNPFSEFLVIGDDDTMWNVDALLDFLSQLDSSQPLYLGERYAHSDYFGKANLKVDAVNAARKTAEVEFGDAIADSTIANSHRCDNAEDLQKCLESDGDYGSVADDMHSSDMSDSVSSPSPKFQSHLSAPDQLRSFDKNFGEKRYQGTFNRFIGTDYITTGGGLVLTNAALKELFNGRLSDKPECGRANTPDDMALGGWMNRRNIMCMHNGRFHQRRPEDYPEFQEGNSLSAIPASARPISFHSVFQSKKPEPPEVAMGIYGTWLK